jgi:hypothetical protein
LATQLAPRSTFDSQAYSGAYPPVSASNPSVGRGTHCQCGFTNPAVALKAGAGQSGGFIQAFLYGVTGLRIEQDGLVPQFAPTLPKELTYLKLVNIMVRGQAFEVSISWSSSGRVVRQVTAITASHT